MQKIANIMDNAIKQLEALKIKTPDYAVKTLEIELKGIEKDIEFMPTYELEKNRNDLQTAIDLLS